MQLTGANGPLKMRSPQWFPKENLNQGTTPKQNNSQSEVVVNMRNAQTGYKYSVS